MVGRKSQTFPANFTKELMKNKKILIFFRASLGDFYLNFPLFESFRNQKYKGDELTLVTSPLVLDMLYKKKLIQPKNYKTFKLKNLYFLNNLNLFITLLTIENFSYNFNIFQYFYNKFLII